MKNIHWKLSAKRDELQTKEFEQTVSNKLFIMINGQTEPEADLDREELMVSFVLSLIKDVLNDDVKTKLIMNDGHSTVIEGGTRSDFQGFMESMTSFECTGDLEFSSFVNKHLTESTIDETVAHNAVILVTQTVSSAFFDAVNTHGQMLNVFTFSPKTAEAKEVILKNQSKMVRFHFIDQIMDVAYGK